MFKYDGYVKDSVYFWSDLHLGHTNVCKWREDFDDHVQHSEYMFERLEQVGKFKRNTIYLLGDVAFDAQWAELVASLPATIHLVMGNHDLQYVTTNGHKNMLLHLSYCTVEGLKSYKKFWLSHAPIHPAELRGRVNIHGHVHTKTLDDPWYINVCPENCPTPVGLRQVKSYRDELCKKEQS